MSGPWADYERTVSGRIRSGNRNLTKTQSFNAMYCENSSFVWAERTDFNVQARGTYTYQFT